jgi:hypothetical protein
MLVYLFGFDVRSALSVCHFIRRTAKRSPLHDRPFGLKARQRPRFLFIPLLVTVPGLPRALTIFVPRLGSSAAIADKNFASHVNLPRLRHKEVPATKLARWGRETSYWPFAAIVSGKSRLGGFGMHALAGGLVLWLAATWAHIPLASRSAGIWRWL